MEIKYLQFLYSFKEIEGEKNVPASIEEIEALEARVGRTFPKSYREFLYLCGNGSSMLAEVQHEIEIIEEIQEWAYEVSEEFNFSFPNDFWVIAEYQGCDQFYFFEWSNDNDPIVYYCDRGFWGTDVPPKGHEYIQSTELSFSQFIKNRAENRKETGY